MTIIWSNIQEYEERSSVAFDKEKIKNLHRDNNITSKGEVEYSSRTRDV